MGASPFKKITFSSFFCQKEEILAEFFLFFQIFKFVISF